MEEGDEQEEEKERGVAESFSFCPAEAADAIPRPPSQCSIQHLPSLSPNPLTSEFPSPYSFSTLEPISADTKLAKWYGWVGGGEDGKKKGRKEGRVCSAAFSSSSQLQPGFFFLQDIFADGRLCTFFFELAHFLLCLSPTPPLSPSTPLDPLRSKIVCPKIVCPCRRHSPPPCSPLFLWRRRQQAEIGARFSPAPLGGGFGK